MNLEICDDIASLEARLTPRRVQLLRELAAKRSRFYCMVLEDLVDPHNISAVIRTSEVFGLQDVHIIEEVNAYEINKSVLKGSFKWMNLYRYKQRSTCMDLLKSKGYQIAVASTNTSTPIYEIDLDKPTAFYMGSERFGNHPETLEKADVHFILPQYGITESMNVSVAAGVLMTHLECHMRAKSREQFCLNSFEQEKILLEWYKRHVYGTEISSPVTRINE
jgi:tRNA (guanosine-2'-O-)-methyltransferase